jgi:RNA polymerase sigma-70 factor (ECF subfamily)
VNVHTHDTDNELLCRIADKNEAAFTELYSRYWQKLFAIAYNRLQDRESAEDAVHDVFAALWVNSQLNEIQSPANYLATAIKYTVLGKIKKIIQEREHLAVVAPGEIIDTTETALHNRQVLELIRQEIEQLPEKCRLIFQYSRNGQMPVKQIAARLAISPKTVENQLGKAVRHLRLATRHFFHLLALLPWLY